MLTLEDISEVDRIVAIDVEATGHRVLTPAEIGKLPKGMRPPGVIIQIGCVELLRDGAAWCTGATWETLLNPEAPILPAASASTGSDRQRLRARHGSTPSEAPSKASSARQSCWRTARSTKSTT